MHFDEKNICFWLAKSEMKFLAFIVNNETDDS